MHFNLISDLDENPAADLQDRALHYGDGLFETLLVDNGQVKFWPEHYHRLQISAHRLNIACPDVDWLQQQLQPYINLDQRLVIKIILTRGCGGRGIQLPEKTAPNIYLLKYSSDNIIINQPVKVTTSSITLPDNLNLAGIKHLNRLDYVLASSELGQTSGFDDALLRDSRGHVVEGIIHNLFFVRDGIIHSPDLGRCGVDGVMRQVILKKLKQWQNSVKIGHYSLQDVLNADECFLCNSVQGIRPIHTLGQHTFATGDITQRLQQITR